MLHAKFKDHMTSGSGEDFSMFLPNGRGGHLGHRPKQFIQTFVLPS